MSNTNRNYLHDDAITVARKLWDGLIEAEIALSKQNKTPPTELQLDPEWKAAATARRLLDQTLSSSDSKSFSHTPQFRLGVIFNHLMEWGNVYRDAWEKDYKEKLNERKAAEEKRSIGFERTEYDPTAESNPGDESEETGKIARKAPRLLPAKFDIKVLPHTASSADLNKMKETTSLRPMSWLFQKRIRGEWICLILYDSEYIANRHHLKHKSAYATKAVVIKCILHELMHYVMHADKLVPALPENNYEPQVVKDSRGIPVRAEWATADEEDQAWVGAMTLYGLMLGAIAHNHRGDGDVDREIDYL
jgi:hypothetical protein